MIDVPNVGRMQMVKDPQGAAFYIYEPASEQQLPEAAPELGEASWHELMTTDAEAAMKFYGELFGWKPTETMDMGPMGKYHMFGRHLGSIGGMMNKPPEMAQVPPQLGHLLPRARHQRRRPRRSRPTAVSHQWADGSARRRLDRERDGSARRSLRLAREEGVTLSQPADQDCHEPKHTADQRQDERLARSDRSFAGGDGKGTGLIGELFCQLRVGSLVLFELGDALAQRVEITARLAFGAYS